MRSLFIICSEPLRPGIVNVGRFRELGVSVTVGCVAVVSK
jgi:hypothetical protein